MVQVFIQSIDALDYLIVLEIARRIIQQVVVVLKKDF